MRSPNKAGRTSDRAAVLSTSAPLADLAHQRSAWAAALDGGSVAFAINDSGVVVGYAYEIGPYTPQAFVWTMK
jgi:probable HAF family extracellular repeat protein